MDVAAIEDLLTRAAGLLDAELSEDEAAARYALDVRFADGRQQRVYVFLGAGSPHYRHLGDERRIAYASSYVGELTDGVDAGDLLRKNAESSLAAVSVFFKPGELQETIYTSAGLPLAAATPEALAAVIDETAGMADAIEEELFGVDRY